MTHEFRERFDVLRSVPPAAVTETFGGDTGWVADRVGDDGEYPNGGLWRVHRPDVAGESTIVKRTGPHFLGANESVWRGSVDSHNPQWWGREASFYGSEFARSGWPVGCRAARCYAVDDHDGVRDLWLEDVAGIPLDRNEYARVVHGLAYWQGQHREVDHSWLSRGWIPEHLRRRGMDNDRTLDHPGWSKLFDAGFSPVVRDAVRSRVTDPEVAARMLDALPQLPTHYDFHHMNIGQVGDEVVIIDWATVGLGPVGHDVGFLLVDHAPELGSSLPAIWDQLVADYTEALRAAGADFDFALVQKSVAISNAIRLGWMIDYLLDLGATLDHDQLAAFAAPMEFLSTLQRDFVAPALAW